MGGDSPKMTREGGGGLSAITGQPPGGRAPDLLCELAALGVAAGGGWAVTGAPPRPAPSRSTWHGLRAGGRGRQPARLLQSSRSRAALGSPSLGPQRNASGHEAASGRMSSRCLDLQPGAWARGTPWPQLSGLFWVAPPGPAVSWQPCPRAVKLEVASVELFGSRPGLR